MVFRFLEQFLHTWHPAPFFGLLDPVIGKDMKILFFVKWCVLPDGIEPALAYFFQRPGKSPEKTEYRKITVRSKCCLLCNQYPTHFPLHPFSRLHLHAKAHT